MNNHYLNMNTKRQIKTFKEYQTLALTTAIYPRNDEDNNYVALGMLGESGEIADKLKKMLRDDDGILTDERAKGIALEIGDVMWYVANYAKDNRIFIDYDLTKEEMVLKDFATVMLPVEICGVVSEIFWHGRGYYKNFKKKRKVRAKLIDIMDLLAVLSKRINYSLKDCCEMNIKKLESRVQRDSIHGSGDYR